MHKLPKDLISHCQQFWPETKASDSALNNYDGRDITVVTAFFDLGRSEWKVGGGKTSPFQRSLEHYFEYFAHLAKLKNPMVVFVAPEHSSRVLNLRKAAGLENITTVYTISNLFDLAEIKPLVDEAQIKMTPAFWNWTRFPKAPEYNYGRYAVLDALKSIFVNTAIVGKAVPTQQVAWLDFGYARDERCFDAAMPWRFDAGGKMNLFHMRPIDDVPVFKVVQRGYVYFQGGCKIGPVTAWPAFSETIDYALAGLLTADLVDDEQTLLLMAWRANPGAYRIHAMDRRDWRVVIRFFNEDRQGEDVPFRDYRFVNAVKASTAYGLVKACAAFAGRIADKFV